MLHFQPMMRLLIRGLPFFALWLLIFGQSMTPAYAESGMQLQVVVGADVLTCSAAFNKPPGSLERALSEGSEISVSWHLSVDIERKYWLNKSVASIEVIRRVVPDLVSQSWQLEDQTSGISRRVFRLEDAINFLTRLRNFPVVDRSLLTDGQAYVLKVGISEREGGVKDSWWRAWIGSENSAVTKGFVLP